MQFHINKISDEFDNETDLIVNNRVMALCCFITVGPCVHNNFDKYEQILMKFGIKLHINISDEINIGADSTLFTELWPFATFSCEHDNFSKC